MAKCWCPILSLTSTVFHGKNSGGKGRSLARGRPRHTSHKLGILSKIDSYIPAQRIVSCSFIHLVIHLGAPLPNCHAPGLCSTSAKRNVGLLAHCSGGRHALHGHPLHSLLLHSPALLRPARGYLLYLLYYYKSTCAVVRRETRIFTATPASCEYALPCGLECAN